MKRFRAMLEREENLPVIKVRLGKFWTNWLMAFGLWAAVAIVVGELTGPSALAAVVFFFLSFPIIAVLWMAMWVQAPIQRRKREAEDGRSG